MANCVTLNSKRYREIASRVGEVKAAYLIGIYGDNIPVDELYSGSEDLNKDEVLDILHNEEEYVSNSLGEIENDVYDFDLDSRLYADNISNAILRIENRKKLLQSSLGGNPKNKVEIVNRIIEMDDDIKQLKAEGKLSKIIEVAEKSVDTWVKGEVVKNRNLTASEVIQGFHEVSNLKAMVENLLQYDGVDKNGDIVYQIGNKDIVERAEGVLNKLVVAENALNTIASKLTLREMNKKLDKPVSADEVSSYIDIDALSSVTMDLTRVNNKLAQYISTVLTHANRNAMSEFNEELNKPLKDLEKKAGMDLTKESDYKQFLQLDAEGKPTTNLLTRFSQEYFEFKDKMFTTLRVVERADRASRIKSQRANNIKRNLIENINNELVIADVRALQSGKETRDKEIERLVKELGTDEAIEMVREADTKFNDYLENLEEYKQRLATRKEEGKEGYINDMDRLKKLEAYEAYNNPINFLNNLESGKDSVLAVSALRKLAFSPRKSDKWYDKRYESLTKDANKFELYNFITTKLKEYKNYLPSHISDSLQENFLPEVHKQLTLTTLTDGNLGTKMYDMLLRSISTEEDNTTVYKVLGPDNKPIKGIPIKFAVDNVRRYRNKITRLEAVISNNLDIIKARENYLAAQQKLYKDKPSTLWDPMDINIKAMYEENIKNLTFEIQKAQAALPMFKEKLDKIMAGKSLDIIQTLKAFGMMAINYKNKAIIQDKIELARREVHKASVLQTTSSMRVLTDKLGNKLSSSEGSNLQKLVDYTVDALLYGEYKANKGTGQMKIGITKEAREKLKKIHEKKEDIRKTWLSGGLNEENYLEMLDELKEEEDGIEGARNFTVAKAADTLMNYTYKLNLGWNPQSAVANVAFGKLANRIEAGAGRYFNKEDLRAAEKLFRNSVIKSVTGSANDTANKIRNLINKFDILFDLLEDSYGSNRGLSDKQKKLGFVNSMEMQRRGEYYNQGTVLVATLLHKKIKDKNGNEISVWDLFDVEGNIKPDLLENPEQWESVISADGSNEFSKHRDRVIQLNKRLHGNYDPSSPLLGKKTALGRTLFMFKSWMPEGFATRFEKEKYDQQLHDYVKGRYRTFQSLGFTNSAKTVAKMLTDRMVGNALDAKYPEMTQLDFENMKRNLVEIQWALVMMGLFLLSAMVFDDDDEKKPGIRHTLDLLGRLQQDITLYMNPVEMLKLSKNPAPLLSTVNQIVKMPKVVYNYSFSENANHDTEYFLRNVSKLVPGAKAGFKVLVGDGQ